MSVWTRLCQLHEQNSEENKICLLSEFSNESMESYINRAEYIYGQLKDIGVKDIDEEALISKIVSGLPAEYHGFMTLWNSTEGGKDKLDKLVPRLCAEEKLVQRFFPGEQSGQALIGETSGSRGPKKNHKNNNYNSSRSYDNIKSGNRNHGNNTNYNSNRNYDNNVKGNSRTYGNHNNNINLNRHPTNIGNNSSKNVNKDRSSYKCFKCDQVGHLIRDCPQNKSENAEAVAIIAELNYSGSSNDEYSGWILDSGANEHMSGTLSLFSSYKKLKTPRSVRFGDGNIRQAIGMGDIKLTVVISHKLYQDVLIKNVWYVPYLRRNLVSQSLMMQRGMIGEIGPDKVTMINPTSGKVLFHAFRKGGLLHLWLKNNELGLTMETCIAESSDHKKKELTLWHERLVHNNLANIEDMSKLNSVIGLPDLSGSNQKEDTSNDKIKCVSCNLGKQHRKTFPERMQPRATKIGQRLHIDMCGPIGVATLGG